MNSVDITSFKFFFESLTMKLLVTRCVYDKDHTSALQMKNTIESDPCSYEVVKNIVVNSISGI